MSDFILFFSGREGSSPLISELAKHPRIFVPIFEDFDWRNLKTPLSEHGLHVEEFIADLFNRKQMAPSTRSLLKKSYGHDRLKRFIHSSDKVRIGFKWRPWGDPALLREKLQRPIKTITLARRDLLNFTLSLLFSAQLKQERPEVNEHPQFYAKQLTDQEYREFMEYLAGYAMQVEETQVLERMRASLVAKKAMLDFVHAMSPEPPLQVYYEDLFPANKTAMDAIYRFLKVPPAAEAPKFSEYKKAGLLAPQRQITNFAELLACREICALQEEWAGLFRKA